MFFRSVFFSFVVMMVVVLVMVTMVMVMMMVTVMMAMMAVMAAVMLVRRRMSQDPRASAAIRIRLIHHRHTQTQPSACTAAVSQENAHL
jgi:hypothetical protein